jgi:hypothetical protein
LDEASATEAELEQPTQPELDELNAKYSQLERISHSCMHAASLLTRPEAVKRRAEAAQVRPLATRPKEACVRRYGEADVPLGAAMRMADTIVHRSR